MQTTGRDVSNAKYSVFESITSARPTCFTHEAQRRRMQHDTDSQHLIVVTVHVTSTPMCISVAWKRSYDHSNVPLWECLRWRPDIRSTGHIIQHGTLFPMSKVKVVSRGSRLSRHCSATEDGLKSWQNRADSCKIRIWITIFPYCVILKWHQSPARFLLLHYNKRTHSQVEVPWKVRLKGHMNWKAVESSRMVMFAE